MSITAVARIQTIYDMAFKRLMRRKEVLAYVAGRYVDEFRGMRPGEVVPYLEDPQKGMALNPMDRESDDESGVVQYDTLVMVRSRLRRGRVAAILNIEGQNDPYPLVRTGRRVQYTAARLVCDQKGVFFKGDAYGGMVDVVTLWLMLRPPKRYEGLVVEDAPLRASQEPAPGDLVDALQGLKKVVVFVPGEYEVPYKGMAGLFSLYLRSGGLGIGERRRLLRERYGVDLTAEAEEEMQEMESMGAALRREARNEGVQFGLRQGRQEGMRQGIPQGRKEASVQLVANLSRRLAVPVGQAMDLLGIPMEERAGIQEALAKQKSDR